MVSEYSRTRRVNEPERQPGIALPSPVPESALYRAAARDLAHSGYTCWRDVSFLGSWIDLYAKREDGSTIAIELKVTDWSRALQQATRIRNAANEVFIGIWAPYVHRALTDSAQARLEALGLGVLSINGHADVKLPALRRGGRYAQHVLLPARATHRPK